MKLYIFDEEIIQPEDNEQGFWFGSMIFIADSPDEALAMFETELKEMEAPAELKYEMAEKPIVKGLVGSWG